MTLFDFIHELVKLFQTRMLLSKNWSKKQIQSNHFNILNATHHVRKPIPGQIK